MSGDVAVTALAAAAGVVLPKPPPALGSYVPHMIRGSYGVLSGQFPVVDGAVKHPGLLGAQVTLEQGREAARLAALNVLAQLEAVQADGHALLGLLRVDGYVASSVGFTDQPAVLEGASELLQRVLGDRGRHSRSAVGVTALPLDAAVQLVVSFAAA